MCAMGQRAHVPEEPWLLIGIWVCAVVGKNASEGHMMRSSKGA